MHRDLWRDHSLMLSKSWSFLKMNSRPGISAARTPRNPGRASAQLRPPGPSSLPQGLAVLTAKGCTTCHSVDGKPKVGPTLKALYGREQQILVAGNYRTITVDEAFLRRSITNPMGQVSRLSALHATGPAHGSGTERSRALHQDPQLAEQP